MAAKSRVHTSQRRLNRRRSILSTLAKLPNGSLFAIVRTYAVEAKLSIEELAAKGESLCAEARLKEQLG